MTHPFSVCNVVSSTTLSIIGHADKTLNLQHGMSLPSSQRIFMSAHSSSNLNDAMGVCRGALHPSSPCPLKLKHAQCPECMAPKDAHKRKLEVDTLRSKLAAVGFPNEDIQDILRAMDTFADDGTSFTCKKVLGHFGVRIVCVLSNQSHIDSRIVIQRVSK